MDVWSVAEGVADGMSIVSCFDLKEGVDLGEGLAEDEAEEDPEEEEEEERFLLVFSSESVLLSEDESELCFLCFLLL